jgi:hypothetical protein
MTKRVGPPGFEPGTNRLCIPLQLSLPRGFCGLDYPFTLALGLALGCLPSSLYTFPDWAWLGITLSDAAELGFPEFDRFHREVSLSAALDESPTSRLLVKITAPTAQDTPRPRRPRHLSRSL